MKRRSQSGRAARPTPRVWTPGERASSILISRSSSAGWNSIPTPPPKSSSGCEPRRLIPGGSPCLPTMCAGCGRCVRQPSSLWHSRRANARKSIGAAPVQWPSVQLADGSRSLLWCSVTAGCATSSLPWAKQPSTSWPLTRTPSSSLAVSRPKCLSITSRLPCCIIPSGKGRSFIRDIWTSQLTTALSHAPAMWQGERKRPGRNRFGYVKKNFLAGLELPPGLNALNAAARHWLDTVANTRIHGETHKQPLELFALEKRSLSALPSLPADTGVTRTVPANNRFRVVLDTNRYSVPSRYASQRLLLKTFADRLCIYHDQQLVATHPRSYDRYKDFEDPDHVKELLDQRRAARDAKVLLRFYALCPQAEEYLRQLKERRLNPRQHVAKIIALSEVYSPDKVACAIEDSFEFQAFSSDYIANILEQRERFSPQAGPLHLTRRQDLLELELTQPDLSVYEVSNTIPTVIKP